MTAVPLPDPTPVVGLTPLWAINQGELPGPLLGTVYTFIGSVGKVPLTGSGPEQIISIFLFYVIEYDHRQNHGNLHGYSSSFPHQS